MLKFTNTQKTAASFNGASFSLAAPDDFASIGDGPTRDAVLDWLEDGNLPLPADTPPPPTPLEQIRALEQKHEDDQRKITRISILELALDKMCANAAMVGKTRAQVHDAYCLLSRGYRELFALEVECARLRKLIV